MATLNKYNPLELPLESWEREEGSAAERVNVLFASEDQKQVHGVWEADPGVHANLPGQETVVILEGKATVTGASGESLDVSAGDLVFVGAGEVATWHVHERVRKVFVINS